MHTRVREFPEKGDVPGYEFRLSLNRAESAAALGMSLNTFERHVAPELKVLRVGRLRLFSLRELERWVRENEARTL